MLRLKPEDLFSLTRDQLRHMRYLMRNEAGRGGSGVGSAVQLADAVLTSAEQLALSVLPGLQGGAESGATLLPVMSYFERAHDEHASRRLFCRTHYAFAKALLARFGTSNCLISEAALDVAYDDLVERHADLVWSRFAAGSAESIQQALHIAAALAVRLAEARPIQRLDLDRRHDNTPMHLLLDANRFVFLVAGLGAAILSARTDGAELDAAEVLASAIDVVDLRFSRFSDCFRHRGRVEALAAEFAALVPHLP